MKQRVIAILLVLFLTMPPPPVALAAFSGHEHSAAWETTGGVFTGVRSSWKDLNVNPLCGTAVYQAVWAQITNNNSWEEVGTGDTCLSIDFIYWGYAVNGVWKRLGTAPTPGGVAFHEFKLTINGSPCGTWTYWVDGASKGTDYFCTGIKISTGLETYADLTISAQTYSPMQKQTTVGGAWAGWSGRDAKTVDPTMCGRWAADSDWRAAENAPC